MQGFIAVVLRGQRTARRRLDRLERARPEHSWIEDVAVISRTTTGRIQIHSTWAQAGSDHATGSWGLLACSLIGLLLRRSGIVLEVSVAEPANVLVESSFDIALDHHAFDEFAIAFCKDSSAFLVVGENSTLDSFACATADLGGRIIRGDLSSADMAALRNSVNRSSRRSTDPKDYSHR